MIYTSKVLATNNAVIAAALLVVGGAAQAATWQFSGCDGLIASGETWASDGLSTSTWNSATNTTCGKASDGVAVDLRGYSTKAADGGTKVQAWTGGIGYYNSSTESGNGAHAVDNKDGIDALILKFSQSVSLSAVQIGWNGTDHGQGTQYNDSDLSVYRWAGTTAPTASNGVGLTFSSSAWEFVNHFSNVGAKVNNTVAFNAGNSSYWLVSAYNGTEWTKGNDAFKLLSVAGTPFTSPPTGVPEPGSLALLGLGALGLLAARRKSLSVR